MPIYKTSTGYRVQVDMGRTVDGKRYRQSECCKTLKEAQKIELRMKMEREGLGSHSGRMTLSAFIDEHYLPIKEKTLRRNTLDGYKRDIRRIRPRLGNMKLKDIKRLHVQSLLSSCSTYKVAKNVKETLGAILGEAVNLDVLAKNPSTGHFNMPEQIAETKRKEVWVTSFMEHERIIEAADTDEIERILVLGLCFGLRKGEILGLDWHGVDFSDRTISIYQTYTYSTDGNSLTPPKTRGSIRDIPMTDLVYGYLQKWHEADGLSDKVVSIDGKSRPVCRYKGMRVKPKRARDQLTAFFRRNPELPRLTCSSMRHSFATAWVLSGKNVASLSKWLGHANITTTLNKYVKPLQADLATEAKGLSELYLAQNGTQEQQKTS